MKIPVRCLISVFTSATLFLSGCGEVKLLRTPDLTPLDPIGVWKSLCTQKNDQSDYQDITIIFENDTSGFIVKNSYGLNSWECIENEVKLRSVHRFNTQSISESENLNTHEITYLDKNETRTLSLGINASSMSTPITILPPSTGMLFKKLSDKIDTSGLYKSYVNEALDSSAWQTSDCLVLPNTSTGLYSLVFHISEVHNTNSDANIDSKIVIYKRQKTNSQCPKISNIGQDTSSAAYKVSSLTNASTLDASLVINSFEVRFDNTGEPIESDVLFEVNSLTSKNQAVSLDYISGSPYWNLNTSPQNNSALLDMNLEQTESKFTLEKPSL